MQFATRKLVVFEGLDATGKSTQMQRLRYAAKTHFEGEEPLFTHQPTGSSATGKSIYRLTEKKDADIHPITRQLLHLASHAEHYDVQILPTLRDHTVFMDRCWWSTVAYGYFDGGLSKWCSYSDFVHLAKLPTQGRDPDLVFLFNKPYVPDAHNTPELEAGYSHLATDAISPTKLIVVPAGDPDWLTVWIMDRLVERGVILMSPEENELWKAIHTQEHEQWGEVSSVS